MPRSLAEFFFVVEDDAAVCRAFQARDAGRLRFETTQFRFLLAQTSLLLAHAVGETAILDLSEQLADPVEVAELQRGIRANKIKVVIIDPLYLSLMAPGVDLQASNLYEMGPLLKNVAYACLQAGATPFLNHHASRPARRRRPGLRPGTR